LIVPARIDPHEDPADTYAAALLRLDRAQQRLAAEVQLHPVPTAAEPIATDEIARAMAACRNQLHDGRLQRDDVQLRLALSSAGVDVFDVFRALRAINASRCTYLLRFSQQRLVGVSSERFEPGHVEPAFDRASASLPAGSACASPRIAAEHGMDEAEARAGSIGCIGFDGSSRWVIADETVVERAGELELRTRLELSADAAGDEHCAAALARAEPMLRAIAIARAARP
jgi:anthranilate/para-aminobenzoate synthase component I